MTKAPIHVDTSPMTIAAKAPAYMPTGMPIRYGSARFFGTGADCRSFGVVMPRHSKPVAAANDVAGRFQIAAPCLVA